MDLPNLSIQAILRENNRERLYVRPISWTQRQLQILNCSFVAEEVYAEKEIPPSESTIRTLSQDYSPVEDIEDLRKADTTQCTRVVLEVILSHYGIRPRLVNRLSFYFGGEKVANVRVDRVFSRSSTPSLAYIATSTLYSLRKKYSSSAPDREKRDELSSRIHDRKRLPIPAEDPYIVSILIALAQAQRHQPVVRGSCSTSRNSNTPVVQGSTEPIQVTVLITPTGEIDFLSVYTAAIPAELLDRLDAPLLPLLSPRVAVKYYCIPLDPARDALKKLHCLLCTGSCRLCADVRPTGFGSEK